MTANVCLYVCVDERERERGGVLLTTVQFVGVVLAVVVSVTHPGATDTFAVVTVEVQRRAGGKHCEQTRPDNKSVSRSKQTNRQTVRLKGEERRASGCFQEIHQI